MNAARDAQDLYKALEQLTQNVRNGFDDCKGNVTV